ncbi:hypothetical protein BASA60_010520 [Batrachochytrium salamandrivorans]|nr:hypothetical protein BASA60_010520 [Batrachochytrium salamandrivorans]
MNFLSALYSTSNARIRSGSLLSDPFPVQRGVRQGCPLSGLLFNVFINDVLDGVAPISVPGLSQEHHPRGLMFADDIAIIAPSHESLCTSWYEYLGVIIDDLLTLSPWLAKKKRAITAAVHSISPLLRNNFLSTRYRLTIFNGLVLGVAYYGLELIGGNSTLACRLQAPVNTGIRMILKAPLFTPIAPMLTDCGIISLDAHAILARRSKYALERTFQVWGKSKLACSYVQANYASSANFLRSPALSTSQAIGASLLSLARCGGLWDYPRALKAGLLHPTVFFARVDTQLLQSINDTRVQIFDCTLHTTTTTTATTATTATTTASPSLSTTSINNNPDSTGTSAIWDSMDIYTPIDNYQYSLRSTPQSAPSSPSSPSGFPISSFLHFSPHARFEPSISVAHQEIPRQAQDTVEENPTGSRTTTTDTHTAAISSTPTPTHISHIGSDDILTVLLGGSLPGTNTAGNIEACPGQQWLTGTVEEGNLLSSNQPVAHRISQRWFWSCRTKQPYRNRYWLTPQVRPKTVKQRHSFALMETLRTCGDSASLQKYVTRQFLDTSGFFKDPSFDQSRAHGTRYLMLARIDALWTARKAIQIGILVDTHPFSVDTLHIMRPAATQHIHCSSRGGV